MENYDDESKIFKVEPNKEARFVNNFKSNNVSIELIDGSGEIFGGEMILNRVYNFSSSFSVVTKSGCSLKVIGRLLSFEKVSRSHTIENIHSNLEEKRCQSEKTGDKGPVVCIVGPMDVGKSTLTRTLLNFAARDRRKVLYIDLDVGQSSISISGTLSVACIESLDGVERGVEDAQSSVYFFGYKSPSFNDQLYQVLVEKLAESVRHRMESLGEVRTSGAIIDTCGWVAGPGYFMQLAAIQAFNANIVLVLDDEKAYGKFRHDVSPGVAVQYIPKLSGVVPRNQAERRSIRDSVIYEYFYGEPSSPLNPYTFECRFNELRVFRVIQTYGKETQKSLSLQSVDFSPELRGQVLALSYAEEGEDVMTTCVYGFICIRDVDMRNEIVTVLSPKPKPLPTNILIIGDIQLTRMRND